MLNFGVQPKDYLVAFLYVCRRVLDFRCKVEDRLVKRNPLGKPDSFELTSPSFLKRG
jgi:hypothetical protein